MQADQQHKASVQGFIDKVKGKVCEPKPIKSIYKDSKGFSVYLGLDKKDRRVRQRFKQGEEFAKTFQKLWNNALSKNDKTSFRSNFEKWGARTSKNTVLNLHSIMTTLHND